MDLINWKIKKEDGTLIATTQISISSNPNRSGSLLFEISKNSDISKGNYLLIESPIGTPIYRVQVTGIPTNPDNKEMIQVQTEIQPF